VGNFHECHGRRARAGGPADFVAVPRNLGGRDGQGTPLMDWRRRRSGRPAGSVRARGRRSKASVHAAGSRWLIASLDWQPQVGPSS